MVWYIRDGCDRSARAVGGREDGDGVTTVRDTVGVLLVDPVRSATVDRTRRAFAPDRDAGSDPPSVTRSLTRSGSDWVGGPTARDLILVPAATLVKGNDTGGAAGWE
jgi:hypothetical protein